MTNLNKANFNRIFTFGCSFTEYSWPTYADFLAYDLNIPLYNFGAAGAGNEYIANTVLQYDTTFGFKNSDLVIVQWTSLLREDRFFPEFGKRGSWVLKGYLGNNFDWHSIEFLKYYISYSNCMIKQFPLISAVQTLLEKKTNPIFLTMSNLDQTPDNFEREICKKAIKIYKPMLNNINPSFTSTLWNNNFDNAKLNNFQSTFGGEFSECHPSPFEHFAYIENALQHYFRKETRNKVKDIENNLIDLIRHDIRKHGEKAINTGSSLKTSTEDLYLVKNQVNEDYKFSRRLIL